MQKWILYNFGALTSKLNHAKWKLAQSSQESHSRWHQWYQHDWHVAQLQSIQLLNVGCSSPVCGALGIRRFPPVHLARSAHVSYPSLPPWAMEQSGTQNTEIHKSCKIISRSDLKVFSRPSLHNPSNISTFLQFLSIPAFPAKAAPPGQSAVFHSS